jgi:hypothetical protein
LVFREDVTVETYKAKLLITEMLLALFCDIEGMHAIKLL